MYVNGRTREIEVRKDIRKPEKFSHKLHLPVAPADLRGPVKAWRQDVEIDTYAPENPDRNPMFLEKRFYGLGKVQESELLLQVLLTTYPSHAGASDLLQRIHIPKTTFRAG